MAKVCDGFKLFELIGLALPDTVTVFRLKVLVAGIVGLGMGLLFMRSGIEGSAFWGGAIAACGLALTAITVRNLVRDEGRRVAERTALREREESEARCQQELLAGQRSCEHSWVFDEQAMDYDIYQMHCASVAAWSETVRPDRASPDGRVRGPGASAFERRVPPSLALGREYQWILLAAVRLRAHRRPAG